MPRIDEGTKIPGKPCLYQMQDGRVRVIKWVTNEKGQRQKFDTFFKTMKEAEIFRDELSAKKVLKKLPKPGYKDETIGHMIALSLAKSAQIRSFEDKKRYMVRIVEFFGKDTPIASVDEILMSQFITWLTTLKGKTTKAPLSNKTQWHHLCAMAGLLKMAHRKGFIRSVPEWSFEKDFGEREVNLTPEYYLRILDELPRAPEPFYGMWLYGYYTGARLGDIRHARIDQIQDVGIHYVSTKTRKKGLVIPEGPRELMDELKALIACGHSETWVFASKYTGKPYEDKMILRGITDACMRAGVPRVTPHELRHMVTSMGLKHSDPQAVVDWVGWVDEKMLATYGKGFKRVDEVVSRQCEELARLREENARLKDEKMGEVIHVTFGR